MVNDILVIFRTLRSMYKLVLTVGVVLCYGVLLHSGSYTIGPSSQYSSPNALYLANVLSDGDTIYIEGHEYRGQDALAQWKEDDLYILGVTGRPHLIAEGQYILGKGIWVLSGDDIHVSNIEFSGAVVPDKNGAGIRLDGVGMRASYCVFRNNENGILTSNPGDGDIVIENCEFDSNGHGDGFSHNLYIGRVASLTFRFNYSHHAIIGHNLKSRARENFILYNRIMDEEAGTSSRLIDVSNGGNTVIMGNSLMQGPSAPNKNLIGYGLEGLNNGGDHNLYVVFNTLVNKRIS